MITFDVYSMSFMVVPGSLDGADIHQYLITRATRIGSITIEANTLLPPAVRDGIRERLEAIADRGPAIRPATSGASTCGRSPPRSRPAGRRSSGSAQASTSDHQTERRNRPAQIAREHHAGSHRRSHRPRGDYARQPWPVVACGADAEDVEPYAAKDICECCGKPAVYGVELIAIMTFCHRADPLTTNAAPPAGVVVSEISQGDYSHDRLHRFHLDHRGDRHVRDPQSRQHRATTRHEHSYVGADPHPVPDTIGQALLDENHRSVNHRFHKDVPAPRYRHLDRVFANVNGSDSRLLAAEDIIKPRHFLAYRSCKHDDWEIS
jgi:hypothetical protein